MRQSGIQWRWWSGPLHHPETCCEWRHTFHTGPWQSGGSVSMILVAPYRAYPRFCRADWGEYFILAWQILGKLPANSSANLDSEFPPEIFRPCFSRVSGPPPPPKLHAQNSHPTSSAFLSNFTFWNSNVFHADFLLTRETNIFAHTPPLGKRPLLLGIFRPQAPKFPKSIGKGPAPSPPQANQGPHPKEK